MASSNIIGANWGAFPQTALAKTYGTFTLATGAGPVSSGPISVPFLSATDDIKVYYLSGSSVAGPLVITSSNLGLSNASFVVTSTGNVVAVAGSASAVYRWETVKEQ